MDLGVELDGIGLFALNLVTGILHAVGGADNMVIVRQTLDSVAVAHPHLAAHGHILHQGVAVVDKLQVGAAILPHLRLLHTAAAVFSQILSPVAHCQQRQLAFDTAHIRHWRIGGVATIRASRKNNTFHIRRQSRNLVVWMYFTINIQFAYLTGNKLSVLRTKI